MEAMRVSVRGGQRERGAGRGRGRGQRRGPVRRHVSDDIRATLVDHVINHGLSTREAGQRVHPNLSRYTVASIIRTFRLENRMVGRPPQGGREWLFTQQQELTIIEMVRENNAIRLHELQQHIIADRNVFNNINRVSISTLSRILQKHNFRMKQLYRVPFERNSVRVEDLRHDYVQVYSSEFDAAKLPHEFIYVDEAGFSLAKTRRRARNVVGPRAVVNVPGQRGGNITLCAAISVQGVLRHHATLVLYLSPYSPFLNAIEEFSLAWQWKVYDRHAETLRWDQSKGGFSTQGDIFPVA
ncbi:5-(hydroxymethyl)furfural oxidase [Labeo rohita]|uniref:5-(Hydroxymethyl)furfural oxidase n=1 Tax=Labeo rohita TaxID=84645 RepID=A0ABQ8MZ36_LABRO|nr:5-(hydroxymethyl)furfural oxidase [Labeo rohita]